MTLSVIAVFSLKSVRSRSALPFESSYISIICLEALVQCVKLQKYNPGVQQFHGDILDGSPTVAILSLKNSYLI